MNGGINKEEMKNKEEMEKIVQDLKRKGFAFIIYNENKGTAVGASSIAQRLALINIAKTEEKYIDKQNTLKVDQFISNDMKGSTDLKKDNVNYFG